MNVGKRIAAAVLALTLLMVPLAGCGEKKDNIQPLRIATADMPHTFDPALVDTDTEKTVVVHLFENLMKLTEGGVVCAQAKSYTCSDNLDGTETYRFTLRTDIRWSDGKAVTAEDFIYAWQRLVDPETASPNSALLNMVAGYEEAAAGNLDALQVWADDTFTLVVVLNCHCPYFLSSICTAAATMPVRADAAEKENWSMSRSTLVSNGAYHVSSWVDNEMAISLTEDYYDAKRIGSEKLEFRFNTPRDKAMADYDDGTVDVVMESGRTENSRLSYKPEVSLLLINQMAFTLRREEMRQAMSLVIDRNTVCGALNERYIPADGLVPYGTMSTEGGDFRELSGAVIDNNPEDYEANCALAAEKLEKIGYSRTVINELGTITMLHENSQLQTGVAENVQKMWREKLGLQVTLKPVGPEELQNALESGEFTIALTAIVSDRNDASAYLKRFNSSDSQNYGMYYSNAYDMLIRVTESANSIAARDAYMEDAEKMLLQSGYVIPLYNDTHNWLVRDGLVGALDNGQDAHYFAYVRELTE